MNTPATTVDPPRPLAQPVNAANCPLCGQPNLCAMEQARLTGQPAREPCWCTQATFSADLLARVPEPARHTACICARCANPKAATP